MDLYVRLQRQRKLPGLEANTRHIFAGAACGGRRQAPAVARDHVPGGVKPCKLHLEPLDRRIDEARGGAGHGIFTKHVPGFERLPQLELHAAASSGTIEWKAELALRFEPHRIEAIARAAQIIEHAEKILPHEMAQHESIMQRRAPARERTALRL